MDERASSPLGRRTFLRTSGAALTTAALGACAPPGEAPLADARGLPAETLRGVAAAVLPSELHPDEREQAVQSFEQWVAEYQSVAELDHGYGTSELRYGGADPAPGWRAQLAALDEESVVRFQRPFHELDVGARARLIRTSIDDAGSALPPPQRARHVATALMAHWFGSPDATDRCYGREIGKTTCRGLDGLSSPPAPRRET